MWDLETQEGACPEAGLQEKEQERPWRSEIPRELGLPNSRGPGNASDFTEGSSRGSKGEDGLARPDQRRGGLGAKRHSGPGGRSRTGR